MRWTLLTHHLRTFELINLQMLTRRLLMHMGMYLSANINLNKWFYLLHLCPFGSHGKPSEYGLLCLRIKFLFYIIIVHPGVLSKAAGADHVVIAT